MFSGNPDFRFARRKSFRSLDKLGARVLVSSIRQCNDPGRHVRRVPRAVHRAAAREVQHMMLRRCLLVRFLVAAVFVTAILFTAVLSHAPAQQKQRSPERLEFDEKEYKSQQVKQMLQGDAPADKQMLDAAAKYYAYRLTLTELQSKHGKMQEIVKYAESEIDANRREERKNTEAVQIFNAALLTRLKEVLPNPRPIASMNAARILMHMAETGYEEAVDALADALNDAEMNGGTQLYAARGIKDFYKLAFPVGETPPVFFKDRQREARSILALLAALKRQPPQSPPPTPEEIEGWRYLRREIIGTLAFSRYPAVADAKGTLAPEGKTALALARIIRNDGVNPPPRLDEQVEAATGLAMLKMKPFRDYQLAQPYQLDVAAYHLGRFMVDLAQTNQQNTGQDAAKIPWRTFGARLGLALAALKKEATTLKRDDPTKYQALADYVIKVVDLSTPIARALEVGEGPRPDPLASFLDGAAKDAEPIYKGDDTAVVKPGAAVLISEQPKDQEKEQPKEKEKKDQPKEKKDKTKAVEKKK